MRALAVLRGMNAAAAAPARRSLPSACAGCSRALASASMRRFGEIADVRSASAIRSAASATDERSSNRRRFLRSAKARAGPPSRAFAAVSSVAPAWRRRSRQAPIDIGAEWLVAIADAVRPARFAGSSSPGRAREAPRRPRSARSAGAGGRRADAAELRAQQLAERAPPRRSPTGTRAPPRRGRRARPRSKAACRKERPRSCGIEIERRRARASCSASAAGRTGPCEEPRRSRSAPRRDGRARSGRRRIRRAPPEEGPARGNRQALDDAPAHAGHALRQRTELQRHEKPEQPGRKRFAALLDQLGHERRRHCRCRAAAADPFAGGYRRRAPPPGLDIRPRDRIERDRRAAIDRAPNGERRQAGPELDRDVTSASKSKAAAASSGSGRAQSRERRGRERPAAKPGRDAQILSRPVRRAAS